MTAGCGGSDSSVADGGATADGSPAADGDPGSADAAPDPCVGLAEAVCLAEAGCVADYCAICSCTPGYAACRSVEATPTQCPDLYCLQPTCCRSSADCTEGTECVPPGASLCGGACLPTLEPCDSDDDCVASGEASICEVADCSCDGQKGCMTGCTADTDCATEERCGEDHRCRPRLCDEGCLPHFECQESGQCARTVCADDGDCDDGVCVQGGCFDGQGECLAPAP